MNLNVQNSPDASACQKVSIQQLCRQLLSECQQDLVTVQTAVEEVRQIRRNTAFYTFSKVFAHPTPTAFCHFLSNFVSDEDRANGDTFENIEWTRSEPNAISAELVPLLEQISKAEELTQMQETLGYCSGVLSRHYWLKWSYYGGLADNIEDPQAQQARFDEFQWKLERWTANATDPAERAIYCTLAKTIPRLFEAFKVAIPQIARALQEEYLKTPGPHSLLEAAIMDAEAGQTKFRPETARQIEEITGTKVPPRFIKGN